jgi:hypothetical protein
MTAGPKYLKPEMLERVEDALGAITCGINLELDTNLLFLFGQRFHREDIKRIFQVSDHPEECMSSDPTTLVLFGILEGMMNGTRDLSLFQELAAAISAIKEVPLNPTYRVRMPITHREQTTEDVKIFDENSDMLPEADAELRAQILANTQVMERMLAAVDELGPAATKAVQTLLDQKRFSFSPDRLMVTCALTHAKYVTEYLSKILADRNEGRLRPGQFFTFGVMPVNSAVQLKQEFASRFDFWMDVSDRGGTDLVEVSYAVPGTAEQLGWDEPDDDQEEEEPEPHKSHTPAAAASNAGRERRGQITMPVRGRK